MRGDRGEGGVERGVEQWSEGIDVHWCGLSFLM